MNRAFVLLLILLALFPRGALGAIDAYAFPDDTSRERYNRLVEELRCPQCLNTNLAGSDAMIAKDLRREIHRLVVEGKDDDAIRDFMYERYGDFILYRPRLMGRTLMLWFGPLFLLLLGAWVVLRFVLGRGQVATGELSSEEAAKLKKILGPPSAQNGNK